MEFWEEVISANSDALRSTPQKCVSVPVIKTPIGSGPEDVAKKGWSQWVDATLS